VDIFSLDVFIYLNIMTLVVQVIERDNS